jgi:gliding motility-associated lipoprotein GldH
LKEQAGLKEITTGAAIVVLSQTKIKIKVIAEIIKEMRVANKLLFSFLIIASMLQFTGCSDANAVIDGNTEIVNNNWSYANKVVYNVKIDDPSKLYNLYMNLRVTAGYKYSNIFVLMRSNGPSLKSGVIRYEFTLANKDGEWLGKGSGNLYSYQMPFKTNYKFPAKGTYRFEIEQNMRDNPLHEISDVGIRVEKAQ